MRPKYTLITSGGQKFDITKSFFLGQWCDEKLDKKLFPGHHWNDKFKRLKDHKKLKKLYYSLLKLLVKKLNRYHKKNENLFYWEIIIGPWLIFYLSVMFDRWEILRIFFKRNNKNFFLPEIKFNTNSLICNDTKDFWNICTSNNKWNASIFFKIIKYKYNNKILIKKSAQIKDDKKKTQELGPSFLKRIFLVINKFFSFFSIRMNPIILDDLFYSSKYTIFLNLRLFQVPSLLGDFFKLEQSREKINLSKRLQMKPTKLNNKNLMNYILENIFIEIPKCYLEDFNYIENKNSSINKLKKKLIVINQSYAFNERFKFWVAQMRKKGTKIFVTSHGGFLPLDIDGFLNFEKTICNKYLTWNKLYKAKNRVNLPPIQLEKYKNIKQKNNDNCLIISSGILKYACKLQCAPYSENFKIVQNFHEDLIKNVSPKIKQKIKFRSFEGPSYFPLSNNIKKRFSFLSISNPRKISMKKEFELAKILVCSYPETPINDALFSNIPFVILYPKNIYSDFKNYKKILSPLKKNKILFYDPKKLSTHLNNIWDKPERWWLNSKTQECLRIFRRQIIFDQIDPFYKWANYLKQFK